MKPASNWSRSLSGPGWASSSWCPGRQRACRMLGRRTIWTTHARRGPRAGGLHRPHRIDARATTRPSDRSGSRRSGPAALLRQDHRPAQRQHLRRLPLAHQRLRRHPVDRHRRPEQQPGRPGPHRAPQPAANADGDQQRLLSEADVERPIQRSSREIRSTTPRASSSRSPRAPRSSPPATPASITCSSPRPISRRPSRSRWPVSPAPAGSSTTAWARPCRDPDPATGSRNEPIRQAVLDRLNATPELSEPLRGPLPRGPAGRPDHLHDVRPGDRRVRVHAHVRQRADRPVRARRPAGDDRPAEARGAALLRRGRLRPVPRRGRAVERDVQRLPDAHDRRPADRPGLRRGDGELRVLGPRTPTRTSAWRSSRATLPTATGSAPRRCATSRCSRPSSTTAASPGSRTR